MMKQFINDTLHNTSTSRGNWNAMPNVVGVTIIVITFTSIVVSSIVLTFLIRSKTGNLFKWKIIDRFSLYTVIWDLLLYAAQTVFGIHQHFRNDMKFNELACSIYGVLVLEFAFSQIIFSTAMAVYAFNLVIRNRHMLLGKWDLFLLCPVFGFPLIMLTTAACFGQIAPNQV